MALTFVIPVALGCIAVFTIALVLHRNKARKNNERLRSIPQPVTSPRRAGAVPLPRLPAREVRPPVNRVTSNDSALPTYLAANVTPPPPVYDPASPAGQPPLQHSSSRPEATSAPTSTTSTTETAPQPITFPVPHPPTVTPYVPSPPASTRPPAYRSESRNSNSSSTTVRPGMIVGGVQTLGAPPRYEVVMAR